jgi:hypothetical protein
MDPVVVHSLLGLAAWIAVAPVVALATAGFIRAGYGPRDPD